MGNLESFYSILHLKHRTRKSHVMGTLIQAIKSRDVQLCSRHEKSQAELLVNNLFP